MTTSHLEITARSTRLLFQKCFPDSDLEIETHGNVFLATASLHGLGQYDVSDKAMEFNDARYPVVVLAQAKKNN